MAADKIDRSKAKAVIFASGNLRIEGEVFKGPEIRLIDEFNVAHKKFIPIANAKVYTSYNKTEVDFEQKILFFNKDDIVCFYLVEDD